MKRLRLLLPTLALTFCFGHSAFGQATAPAQVAPLRMEVPWVLSRSTWEGRTNPERVLHVTVSLPYGDQAGLQDYVDGLSDPKSPNYRNFLTPREIGLKYGLPETQVQSVVDYLKGQGFKIRLVAQNHLNVLADCTVSQAESAFRTTISDFQTINPFEHGNTTFYSYTQRPQLPAAVAPLVLDVSGLESFTKPRHLALTPTQARTLYNIAPMWTSGFHGEGRNVGISNWDGYRLSNVPLYYSQFSLPTPPGGVGSNITVRTISGGAGSGTPGAEGDLDIQMVLGMAPLCNLTIYDGGSSDLLGVLTQEVNDNTADVITESYGWSLPSSMATSAHNLHLSMSAQGITYMCASGDSGTTLEPYSYPNYDPEVLMVGGTVATVDGSGVRTSEVGWSGSGGGWSTNSATFNVRPSYQVGNGVPTNINFRMLPDVALHASSSSGAYQFYLNGSLTSGYIGTSFACPVFAGSLAVAEQKIISQGGLAPNGAGKQRFGRIQDLFYSQNGRSDVWYDVTSGSNGTLPNGTTSSAHSGWDMVTGWGAIDFGAFVATQIAVNPPATPTNLAASGGNSQVALTWTSSSGAASYKVYRAGVTGGPYSQVGAPANNSYTDSTAVNGTTYFYVVTSVNSAGESGNSNEASATPNIAIPSAPTSLAAVGSNGLVSLSWAASSGATSYNVYRSTVSGGPYSPIGAPTSASYADSSVVNGTAYFYVVTAVNSAGESGNSNQASATPNVPAPPIPTGLTAVAGNAQVSLTWSGSTSATTYNVKRSTVSGGPYATLASPATASFTDSTVTNGTTYYYVVSAVNAGGESGNSSQVSAKPTAPDFTITVSPSNRSISSGQSTTYIVAVGSVGGFSNSVSFSVSGAPSNSTVTFTPSSVTGSGTSTLKIATVKGTTKTTYTLMVKGTSGTVVHSAVVTLNVHK